MRFSWEKLQNTGGKYIFRQTLTQYGEEVEVEERGERDDIGEHRVLETVF